MEITREQFLMLEHRVGEIEKSLNEQALPMLEQIRNSLATIELGVYGDSRNNMAGLTSRIAELEKSVRILEQEKASKQVADAAKINVWKVVLEVLKWASLVFLVAKGILGIDALWGK